MELKAGSFAREPDRAKTLEQIVAERLPWRTREALKTPPMSVNNLSVPIDELGAELREGADSDGRAPQPQGTHK